MRIARADVVPVRLPLRRPLVTARGLIAVRAGFVLRLVDESGRVGAGEASPAYWLGEGSLAETEEGLRAIVAAMGGAPAADEVRRRFLDDAGAARLPRAAACALDTALLDLAARAAGIGVAALLGAAHGSVVATSALVAGRDAGEVGADAAAAVAAGFTAVKTKVGAGSLADDVRRVAAVRAAIGARVALRLDANRAWSLPDARAALAALAPYEPVFVEEPLADPRPDALADLADAADVPLALDESIVDAADLARVVARGVRAHVVLKAARVGGPTRLVALARAAHGAGMPVVVTDSIEGSVGMRLALHAAAALPGTAFAVGLGGAQLADDAAAHALRRPAIALTGRGLDVAVDAASHEAARA